MTSTGPMAPRVSVVIIFLNPGAFLEEAVGSVLQQTFTDWELILVDDGSTDESSRFAADTATQSAGRVRYLEHSGHANLGTSVSRNVGMEAARGEYLLYLDADDVLFIDALDSLHTLAESERGIDAVFGSTIWWNWAPEFADRDDWLQSYGRWVGRFDPPTLLTAMVADESLHPANCSTLLRRRTLLEFGGFEPDFRGMYEDTVLLAKLMLSHSVLVTARTFSAYRMHPASQCHRAAAEGTYHRFEPNEARGRYLRWLKRYNRAVGGLNLHLSFVIERELWAYDQPLLFRIANSRKLHRLLRRMRRRPRADPVGPASTGAEQPAIARSALAEAFEAQGRSHEAHIVRQRADRAANASVSPS